MPGNVLHIPSSSATGPQKRIISQCLDVTGDGTGNNNANGDYSSTAGTFKIAPSSSEIYRISRMIVYIQDTGSFDAGSYGNNITLTNGIDVEYDYDGSVVDLLGNYNVKTTGDWAARCHDVNLGSYGVGDEYVSVRWTFLKSGQYIRLDGSQSQELRIICNDNLTGLVRHEFLVQGYVE